MSTHFIQTFQLIDGTTIRQLQYDSICYRPHPKDGEDTVFTGVCPHPGGGGGGGEVPHLRPIILPLVPCPFWGVPPSPSHNTSTGPMSFPGGYLNDSSKVPSQGGTPVPERGFPPASDGVPPSQGRGTPLRIGQQREYLKCGGQNASCVYAGRLSCYCYFRKLILKDSWQSLTKLY